MVVCPLEYTYNWFDLIINTFYQRAWLRNYVWIKYGTINLNAHGARDFHASGK